MTASVDNEWNMALIPHRLVFVAQMCALLMIPEGFIEISATQQTGLELFK